MNPWFIVAVGAIAIACWGALVLGQRHHRRLVLRLLTGVVALAMSLTTAAAMVNAHYQYLPRVGDVLGADTWPTVNASVVLASASHDAPALDPITASAAAAPAIQGVNATTGPTAADSLPAELEPQAPDARAGHRAASSLHASGAVTSLPVTGPGGELQRAGAQRILVWLPAAYFSQPDRRFPVVYLLHGSPGMPTDWLRGGGAVQAAQAAERAGHPLIVALPRMSRFWMDDSECVDGRRQQVETYFISDVVPSLDRDLRTIATRAGRAVAGMSAGGYCALNLGIRHRELFAHLVDLSGFDHPTHTGGMRALFGDRPDLAQVVADNTPADFLDRHPLGPPVDAWLGSGSDDSDVLPQIRLVATALHRHGIAADVHLHPGSHTFGVWRPQLRDALLWLGRGFASTPGVSASAGSTAGSFTVR